MRVEMFKSQVQDVELRGFGKIALTNCSIAINEAQVFFINDKHVDKQVR